MDFPLLREWNWRPRRWLLHTHHSIAVACCHSVLHTIRAVQSKCFWHLSDSNGNMNTIFLDWMLLFFLFGFVCSFKHTIRMELGDTTRTKKKNGLLWLAKRGCFMFIGLNKMWPARIFMYIYFVCIAIKQHAWIKKCVEIFNIQSFRSFSLFQMKSRVPSLLWPTTRDRKWPEKYYLKTNNMFQTWIPRNVFINIEN